MAVESHLMHRMPAQPSRAGATFGLLPEGQHLCPSLWQWKLQTCQGIHVLSRESMSLPWNPCPFQEIQIPSMKSAALPGNPCPFIIQMFCSELLLYRAPAPWHKGKAPVQDANEDKYTICWQSRWLIARGKLNYARSNNWHHGQTPSFVWPIVRHVLEFEFEHEWISMGCVFLHNSHIFLIIFRVVFIWNTLEKSDFL